MVRLVAGEPSCRVPSGERGYVNDVGCVGEAIGRQRRRVAAHEDEVDRRSVRLSYGFGKERADPGPCFVQTFRIVEHDHERFLSVLTEV